MRLQSKGIKQNYLGKVFQKDHGCTNTIVEEIWSLSTFLSGKVDLGKKRGPAKAPPHDVNTFSLFPGSAKLYKCRITCDCYLTKPYTTNITSAYPNPAEILLILAILGATLPLHTIKIPVARLFIKKVTKDWGKVFFDW